MELPATTQQVSSKQATKQAITKTAKHIEMLKRATEEVGVMRTHMCKRKQESDRNRERQRKRERETILIQLLQLLASATTITTATHGTPPKHGRSTEGVQLTLKTRHSEQLHFLHTSKATTTTTAATTAAATTTTTTMTRAAGLIFAVQCSAMFSKDRIHVLQNIARAKNSCNNYFIRTVLDEHAQVKDLHAREIKSTAENPRIRELNETTDISTELRVHKHDQFLEKKRRQQMWENSQDLRQLDYQLRTAFVSKQLADQVAALDAQKAEDIRKKKENDAQIEADRLQMVEMCRENERQERQKKDQFRTILQGQMSETQQRRMKEHEQVMHDREKMKKVLKRMEDENEADLREEQRRKALTRREMDEYLRTHAKFKQNVMEQKIKERGLYVNVRKQADDAKAIVEEKKRQLIARREQMSSQIGKGLYAIESEKKHREDLLLDLLVEERKTKDDMHFKQNLEKQITNRIQVRAELERYTQKIVVEKQNQQRKEDEMFRAEQMEMMAKQAKLDQLSDERRRKKVLEHGRAIQELMDHKRDLRASIAAQKAQEYEMQLAKDRKEQQEIEDERIRILRKQPPEILQFLPTGALRESDLQLLSIKPKN